MIIFNELPSGLEDFIQKVKNELEAIVKKEIGNVDVSFIFITPETMAEMNKQYRGKDGATDVLTFVYGNNAEGEEEPYSEGYLCLEKILENSKEFGNSLEKELLTVLVHSILHMAGYDHEYSSENSEEMFKKQEEYVDKIWQGFNKEL
ncbi:MULTISPECIES: rRNA maturation RNase YbeY [Fervidobacterium]|uniref:Endoribonuclease YbeY n=1 Tax=Fervidobacterium nodosum (strain ATCC 35602 / DSM 5306 / Rt17-B1) TaxID=381764 RepID=A7HLQ5_FERNB|nr:MULTISPECIES: rRNA maturation RNase YbeY [Fervidobacterium]ABS60838.1 protein of unknown function UPF0054 [Fervidobacterium nodosum Rt17-B1]KAF2962035.1 rRNA maturation RNase YbeY [Fervidobacterium sp. 2310opik-2]PHJ13661.1 metalloprotein [Fervidobacterium sp. SC_NGM5_G05]